MSDTTSSGANEKVLRGLGVSEGIVVGHVLRLHDGTPQIFRSTLSSDEIERETERYGAAIEVAHDQLSRIKSRAEKELGADHAYIFDAHLLLLEDRKLRDQVFEYIRRERANAEWALKVVTDRLLAVYAEIKDDYLRERGSDIEDVTQRILMALAGSERPHERAMSQDAVVVAENLLPSAVAELDFNHAKAIATDTGGWTSHTAIIARGLGIPAVVGLRDVYRQARTGDSIIVDAKKGEVILHPTSETMERCLADGQTRRASKTHDATSPSMAPLHTLDGREIFLRANIELPAEYAGLKKYGARGIGLYRSEFLLTHRGAMPDENEQVETYARVAELAGSDGVTVRLFDLGGDKLAALAVDLERNPALGLRAIRFSLRHKEVMRTQVRALLRAAAHGRIDIVLPMISDVSDVRRARDVINEEKACLAEQGVEFGAIRVGAMIEVPSAVLTADAIAREVDFFSLGTNDLIQYLLAVDRGNEEVADWFRSLHPSVLISVMKTIEAATSNDIPVVICGEMAATPVYAIVLVGLGATEFSMTASSIPRVARAVAGVRYDEAKEIASKCLACDTADEIEELVRSQFSSRWPHLFSAETLPPARNSK